MFPFSSSFYADSRSRVKYGITHSTKHDSVSQRYRNDDDHNRSRVTQPCRCVGDSRQHSRNSLVLTRGLSVITQFFSRVKLEVTPNFSVPTLWFRVRNNGKNTATNLRAELFSGFHVSNPIIPYYLELSWRMEHVSEPVNEVSLSYLRGADALCLDLTFVLDSENEIESVYDGVTIGHFSSLKRGRICDVTLHLFGEYGTEKWEQLWLTATGDTSNPLAFEKRSWRYRF